MKHARRLTVAALAVAATPVAAQREPPPRIYHSMVSLGEASGVLVFGGVSEHGWTMDLLDVWKFKNGPSRWTAIGALEPGDSYSAAYDSGSNRVIVFSLAGATWAFNPETSVWEPMSPAESPSGRCGQRTVYDAESDRVVLFGGFACTSVEDPLSDETWAYDYDHDTWERIESAASPPARIYHAMAYDPKGDRTVVWGGRVDDEAVWSFDYNTRSWDRQLPNGGPAGVRAYQTMTYDPSLQGLVVFGGLTLDEPMSFEGELRSDTWILDVDANTWRQPSIRESPAPRSHHAAVYDHSLGAVVIYGGELESSYSGVMSSELWSFDSPGLRWVRLR